MKEILKKNITILIQGTMFGFGFCIAAWVLYFAFQGKAQESHARQYDVPYTAPPAAESDQFTFHNIEEIKRNGRSYFIGTVKNNGSSPARGVNIEVNLFFKGKFVDQYSSYLTGNLEPNEERYFKVSCGCKDEPPAEHDEYKISVVGGY